MCVLGNVEFIFILVGGGPEKGLEENGAEEKGLEDENGLEGGFVPVAPGALAAPLVPIPMPRPEEGWFSWEGVTPAWAARPEPTVAAPKGLRDAMGPAVVVWGVGIAEPGWV